MDTTEKFCKDRAVYNAIVEGIQIIDGKDKSRDAGAIPSILTDALAVGFDNSVGHDYLEDAQSRFEYYHTVEKKIPFDLDFFNRITKGGLPPKTLNIALATAMCFCYDHCCCYPYCLCYYCCYIHMVL